MLSLLNLTKYVKTNYLVILLIAIVIAFILQYISQPKLINNQNSTNVHEQYGPTNLEQDDTSTTSTNNESSNSQTNIDNKSNHSIQSINTIIVLYYGNYCGHCRNFKPIWDKFKNIMEEEKKHIGVVDIECSGNNNECNLPYINGVPTVVLYKDGKHTIYEGPRTVDGLCQFVDLL